MTTSLLVLLAVIALALCSMVVYAARGARTDPDAAGKSAQFLSGSADFVVHWFMWAISPLTAFSLRLGLTPDFFNFLGLAFGMASGAFIATGRLELGGWAIVAGGICDILDGRIARATGVASLYGDFIDSTLDRFVEAAVFLGFIVLLRGTAYGAFLAAAALAGSLIVSYARARGEVHGVSCSGGLMQRGERLVLTCLVCLIDSPLSSLLGWPPGTAVQWTLGLIAVTTFVTAAHRTVWISRRLRAGRRPA